MSKTQKNFKHTPRPKKQPVLIQKTFDKSPVTDENFLSSYYSSLRKTAQSSSKFRLQNSETINYHKSKASEPLSSINSKENQGHPRTFHKSSHSGQLTSSAAYKTQDSDEKSPLIKPFEYKKPSIDQYVTRLGSSSSPIKHKRLSSEGIYSNSETFYREHLFQTFQALRILRSLPAIDLSLIWEKKVHLPRKKGSEDKKTIIFDLDETLVHCVDSLEYCEKVLEVNLGQGEILKIGINVRPYARECLIEASKYFEVIVFTASHQSYADAVLDYLDPFNQLVEHRLYRQNCIFNQGYYIKDIRVLTNRKLKNIVIVDNAAYSFGNYLENGIPIISWHDDIYDKELLNLVDYMKILAQAADVREINRIVFRLNNFYQDYIDEFLRGDTSNALI
jgi:Dullard-like phosphatase family protein